METIRLIGSALDPPNLAKRKIHRALCPGATRKTPVFGLKTPVVTSKNHPAVLARDQLKLTEKAYETIWKTSVNRRDGGNHGGSRTDDGG